MDPDQNSNVNLKIIKIVIFTVTVFLKLKLLYSRLDRMGVNFIILTKASN